MTKKRKKLSNIIIRTREDFIFYGLEQNIPMDVLDKIYLDPYIFFEEELPEMYDYFDRHQNDLKRYLNKKKISEYKRFNKVLKPLIDGDRYYIPLYIVNKEIYNCKEDRRL